MMPSLGVGRPLPLPDQMREEGLNRLLRRADWRFLLPNPRPKKSICFGGGLLSEAVALISDRVADGPPDRHSDCDLAVAVDPDQRTLQAAWAALRPGGSCYTEWYSFFSRSPKSVRRQLEAVGFRDVTCYWARPSPSRSGLWLPVDAPGAIRYIVTNLPRARNAGRHILRLVRRVLWLVNARIGLLPLCAIARKPASPVGPHRPNAGPRTIASDGSPAESGFRAGLLDTIRDGWSSWGLGATPDHLSGILITTGRRSGGKVVAIVFAEPDHRPRLAVKMPRKPESVPALVKEAASLRALQARPGGVPGAPKVLFCQKQAGVLTVGETALTGLPLASVLRRDNFRKLALTATAWLVDLAGQSERCPRDVWWNRLIEPVLADFQASFGGILDHGMFRETADILAALGPLPLVCEQRDFSPWNLLISARGELAVLDWESAELQGLPALDLTYFLAHLAFYLDRAKRSGRFRESYRATLNPSTLTGAVSYECLAHYTRQTDLHPSALRPLRLLVWLLHSRSEYQRMVEDCGRMPERELLRRGLFLSLWEEELRNGDRLG